MAKIIIQSILYLFGLEQNPIPKQSQKTDAENLESDWLAVGNDLRNAMNSYGQN